ncbi:hypothetical protein PIB30_071063 [Stylosanthes scabra]|uniref:Uncharacterized protein n=1 Tax=Stylosanthes scabra TaxID=79078 RepID=A0ABU6RP21_9FABA|nr:hypothetical protein [Stylosanthes scabra]
MEKSENEDMRTITKIFRTRMRTPTLKIRPGTDQIANLRKCHPLVAINRGVPCSQLFLPHLRARVELRVASRIDSKLIQKQLWHYLSPPSGGHNFHTGALIGASFVATRSSLHPLRIYASYEVLIVPRAFKFGQGPRITTHAVEQRWCWMLVEVDKAKTRDK